ncbi:MAG: class I SAM-dependent methyltransferase [Pseudohongiellaceae bacterium]
MGQGALIFNLMARRYSRQPIADQKAYEKKLEITRKYLTPESEVFEFGCGTGSTALLHAPHVKHIHAVDYAAKMIEIANEKRAEDGIDNVSFAVADIDDMPVDKEHYHVVLGLNILQLMEDLDEPLAKVHAMLKPGGYFISSSVCIEKPPGIWGFVLPLLALTRLGPRVKGFSEQQLLDCVKNAGFSLEEQWNPEASVKVVFLVARKAPLAGEAER